MKKFLIIATTVAILMSIFCVTAFAQVESFATTEGVTDYSNNVKQVITVYNSNVVIPLFVDSNYVFTYHNDVGCPFNLAVYILTYYNDIIETRNNDYYLYLNESRKLAIKIRVTEETNGYKLTTSIVYPASSTSTVLNMSLNVGESYYFTSTERYTGSALVAFKDSNDNQFETINSSSVSSTEANVVYSSRFTSAFHTSLVYDLLKSVIDDIENLPSDAEMNLDGFTLPVKPTEVTDIPSVLLTTIKGFINGIGTTFVGAFQSLFMNKTVSNGVATYSGINSLGIYILIFFGVALGYGVVRWLTGLFRRESR